MPDAPTPTTVAVATSSCRMTPGIMSRLTLIDTPGEEGGIKPAMDTPGGVLSVNGIILMISMANPCGAPCATASLSPLPTKLTLTLTRCCANEIVPERHAALLYMSFSANEPIWLAADLVKSGGEIRMLIHFITNRKANGYFKSGCWTMPRLLAFQVDLLEGQPHRAGHPAVYPLRLCCCC